MVMRNETTAEHDARIARIREIAREYRAGKRRELCDVTLYEESHEDNLTAYGAQVSTLRVEYAKRVIRSHGRGMRAKELFSALNDECGRINDILCNRNVPCVYVSLMDDHIV